MHDPLAVAVAARPELIDRRSLPVRIETAGRFTRGMTVVDFRGLLAEAHAAENHHTDVALEVDADAFLNLLRSRLSGMG
jgi:purine nucleosidase